MIKEISVFSIKQKVCELFLQACISPCEDITNALICAKETESTPHAKEILKQLIKNNEIAKSENIPSCQDTGMAVVVLEIGQDVHITGGYINDAVNEGIRQAYEEGYFRKSVLDPITRVNTKDNTPGIIHTFITKGDKIKIHAMPKGFGSENMSQIKMLTAAQGLQGVVDFVVKTAITAGGNPCPPVILGVGIGGTFEYCALMSKLQLTRKLGEINPDKVLNAMEEEIKDKINALKLGAMGMGGDTYCLGVHIAKFPTHIASLPVAVNYCCHALRHKVGVL